MTEKAIGYPCYGYIKFFDTEEAAALLNQHVRILCLPNKRESKDVTLLFTTRLNQ